MSPKRPLLSLFIVSTLALGCEPDADSDSGTDLPAGKPVSSQEARAMAERNLTTLGDRSAKSMEFVDSSSAGASMQDAFDIFLGGSVGADDPVEGVDESEEDPDKRTARIRADIRRAQRVLPQARAHARQGLTQLGKIHGIDRLIARDFLRLQPNTDFGDLDAPLPQEGGIGQDVRDLAQALKEFLNEKILVDNQLESDEGDETIYLLKGATVCDYVVSQNCSSSPDGMTTCEDPVKELDEECAQVVDDAQIRIGARKIGSDTLGLRVMVGPDRAQPFSGMLSPDAMEATLDIAGVVATLNHMRTVVDDAQDWPEISGKGIYHWRLEAKSDSEMRAQMGVSESIEVTGKIEGESFSLSVEKSDPMIDATIDSGKRQIAWEMSYGKVRATVPFDLGVEESSDPSEGGRNENHTAEVFVAGLHAKMNATEDAEVLRVEEVWIGDEASYFAVDDTKIFSILARNDNGNRADFEISPISSYEDLPVATLHDFELEITYAPAPGDLAEDWMASISETVTAKVSGGSPTAAGVSWEALRIIDGTLHVESTAGLTFDFTKDQCVTFGLPEAGESMLAHAQGEACGL